MAKKKKKSRKKKLKKKLKKAKKKKPAKKKAKKVKVKKAVLPKVRCPMCAADFEIDPKTEEGTIIECPDCRSELEVVKKGTKFDVELIEKEGLEEEKDIGTEEWEAF